MGFLDSIGNGIGKIKEDMANKAAMNAQRKAEAAALDAQYRAYANLRLRKLQTIFFNMAMTARAVFTVA